MKKIMMILVVLALLLCTACNAGPQIHLQRAVFDPLDDQAKITLKPGISEIGPDNKGYYIVQFNGPILDEWKAEAKAAGAELLDYIPDYAFIVRADSNTAANLRELPSARWLGDYAPLYRMSLALPAEGDIDVKIKMFPGADRQYVISKITGTVNKDDQETSQSVIRAKVPVSSLQDLARTAGVAWIEPVPEYRFFNNTARGIITANNVWTDIGLYGSGQIAAVCDTGLDNGRNDSTLHADFCGRLLKAYALGRTNDWSDNYGHGTHTTGSVLGNGSASGSNPATHTYTNSFAGVAPEAQLVFQSIFKDFMSPPAVPADLNNLFNPPYNDGARVHSNSWGEMGTGTYNGNCQEIDQFVWNHRDMVICFAAGNLGVDNLPLDGKIDNNSISIPSTAKNCITVGATESLRTGYGGVMNTWYKLSPQAFPLNPIKDDPIANNASGMAAFSSRGPTTDGRIKPDICAPGTNIISCLSHHPMAFPGEGAYNSDYSFGSGTSMSTPITAGSCVLIREFYVRKGINPSAALIKATLLNGAYDMTPGQYTSPQEIPVRPNSVEGWGRVDIKNSLIPPSPRNIYPVDYAAGLSTGSTKTYTYYVASSEIPLNVTLVWSDYPGMPTSAKGLVNDLNLTITGPTGTIYRGNGGIIADNKNNVETIDITNPTPGFYTVTVSAFNVPYGPQPYALVASGAICDAEPTQVDNIQAMKELPDGTAVSITGVPVSAIFKLCFYIEQPDRSSGIKVQYGPGGGPTLTLGQLVSVTGKINTVNGERVIENPIVTF